MFRALRSRNFALLWSGSFVANVGIWMQSVAMGWLIYDLTSSASWLGRVGFASSAPTLLLGLLGGAIIEHADRRRILCGCALVFAAGAFALAGLTTTGAIRVWMVIAISLVSGTANAFFSPVFQAVIPSLVPAEHLMNAISLNSISFNAARVIGPLLGGAVMTWFGPGWCFAVNGCGFLVLVATSLALDMPSRRPAARMPIAQSLAEGLDYARRHPLIRSLLLLCMLLSLFGFPYIVLMPALARDVLHLGPDGFTQLFSSVGAGAVVGGVTLATVGDVRQKGTLVAGCALAFGILVILLANAKSFAPAAIVLALAGFAMITCIAALNNLIQVNVADAMRGRVMSMLTVSLFGLPTLGAWLLGSLGDRVGIPLALSLGGAIVALAAIATWTLSPELRRPMPG
ncbi:MAG TPA: MFS transporter [Candidatus Binatia bacterium]|nr:MFS transporter [Candidatus Binatia bacterium]